MDEGYRLCYVKGSWAWFTTADVTEQWGDDWNDAPYEHNAGRPYHDGVRGWLIDKVAFEGPLETPCEHHFNSPYSVQDINAGRVPWLQTDKWVRPENIVHIWAGTTYPEFLELVAQSGGSVYIRNERR